jgi:ABC-2 type transport system permease protein
MLRNVFTKTLRDHWRGLLGWGLGLVAMAALEFAVYPAIRDSAAEFNKLIDAYPDAFKSMFAIQDFTSGAGFLNAELFSLTVPLVLVVLGISFGAGATAGEEERKTIDLLLANPLPRWRVVAEKLLALVVALVAIGAVLLATLCTGVALLGMGVGIDRLAAGVAGAVLLGLCLGTLAMAVGCATGRRGLAAGVAAAVALAGWLVNSLAPMVEGLAPWRKLTLFYQYLGHDPLRTGLDLGNAAVLVAVAVLLALAALAAFDRRDLAT